MQHLKNLFLNSNVVEDETLADVIRRIGDWLEDEDHSFDDDYVKKQVQYIEKVAQENRKSGIKSKLDLRSTLPSYRN